MKAKEMKRMLAKQRNSKERASELKKNAKKHAKVDIPDKVKDFARIKSAVDAAPELDQSEKVARLKNQIQAGKYEFDYDGMADKLLQQEF